MTLSIEIDSSELHPTMTLCALAGCGCHTAKIGCPNWLSLQRKKLRFVYSKQIAPFPVAPAISAIGKPKPFYLERNFASIEDELQFFGGRSWIFVEILDPALFTLNVLPTTGQSLYDSYFEVRSPKI